ncbi:CGP-CTERM sorting domain-containing protein [Thermococcus sp.]|uniref:CGP-CTERM sorting domain-containing protein n=1 Tax=Thermococcus sp. TaxID=35749 RepID=UPI002619CE33|nr:CGP-CTERM sorting domain-containing protein [Thermococcus sp.]
MSRLVVPLLVLLLFAPMASAVYSVKLNGYLYVVSYEVYSNGTVALINAEIDNTGTTCDMTGNCWMSVYETYDYLFYYNGSVLYLLNFTPALEASLPSYAPKNITYVYFNWVYYTNGSWFVNVSLSAYFPETVESFNKKYVYHLNLNTFCVEQTNVTFPNIPIMRTRGTVNGWKIVVPGEFLPSADYGPFKAYFFVGVNSSVTKPTSVPPFLAIPPHSKLPVYFLLEKGNQVRNVTLFYINATENLTDLWFPSSVKIVNVTFCKPVVAPENATLNGTVTPTSARGNVTTHAANTGGRNVTPVKPVNTTLTSPSSGANTTMSSSAKENPAPAKKNICGPGFMVLVTLGVLLLRKRLM